MVLLPVLPALVLSPARALVAAITVLPLNKLSALVTLKFTTRLVPLTWLTMVPLSANVELGQKNPMFVVHLLMVVSGK
jgi:hypothetical protein